MRRTEKGYGLISLAVVVAIAAMIAAGAGMTSLQFFKGTKRNEDHVKVMQQAHSLGRWFSRDAMPAESITVGDDPETGNDEFLSIYWKDWESGDTYDIRYIWLDDVESMKKLKRSQLIYDKDGALVQNNALLMSDSIYSANFSEQNNTWILNVETRSGGQCSVQEYKATKRVNS